MEKFLGFGLPGISYGCTYAIMAVGLVLTYQATGVFNFAYGAQAYASAFLYAWLVKVHGMSVWVGFLLAVVVLGPGIGLLFDRLLFSRIAPTNTIAKVITGISMAVAIPVLVPFIFGYKDNIYNVPPILFHSNVVYFTVLGTPVNGTDLASVVFTATILVVLVVLMRFTALGLQMRAAVESRRLVQLEGINAQRVVAGAWMISGLMAGLAGVVLASFQAQLQAESYVTLMVAAIAAAAVGAMRSMPTAALVSVAIGVATLVAQGYLPTSSIFFSAVLPSLPFAVLAIALLAVPGMRTLEDSRDPLAVVDPPPPPTAAEARSPQLDRVIRYLWYGLLVAFTASMVTWMPRSVESYFNQGLALSTVFLSITLITGMGGQLSLFQASLAGVGGFTAALMAEHLGMAYFVTFTFGHHFQVSIFTGGIVGAAVAAVVATVVALLSLRLRGLGLALMTLAAAVVFDTAIFSQPSISKSVGGVQIEPGWFGGIDLANPDGHVLFVLTMVVLAVCVFAVLQIRKGSIGRYLAAMRGSEVGAAGIGINLTWQRMLVFALSGAIAGLGGTLYSITQNVVSPTSFNYQFGFAFVVIVITTGVSTVEGAIQGGIGFVVIQQLLTLLPQRFQGLTVALFALGALTYASHPEGIVEFQRRRWTSRFENLLLPPVSPRSGRDGGARSVLAAPAGADGAGGGP